MLAVVLLASLIGGLLGVLGGLLLLLKENLARRLSVYLVAFASGTLLAAAFLDLLPESLDAGSAKELMIAALGGFLVFFILEKFLIIYHCHDDKCDFHGTGATYVYTIMAGDTLHNFVDGVAIAVSFAVDFKLGIATTIAVFAHEVPQEIGDVGVLLHAGLSWLKVIVYNVVSSFATSVGALFGFLLGGFFETIKAPLLAFIAGTFIYVAASDLIPHLQKEWHWKKSIVHILLMILGITTIKFI